MYKIIIFALIAIAVAPVTAKTKIFGEIHASYDNVFAVGSQSQGNLALNHAVIGAKGSIEVKKDISFIYQFSWGISANSSDFYSFEDVNNSGFNNRNQVIGLASPSGAFVVGRFDTPFKTVGRKADLFWHSQLGQNRNVTNAQTWDLRADKIIAFQTPIIKGFQGSIAYASDISDTSRITPNASSVSLNGFYKTGKYILSVGFEQHNLKDTSADMNALRLSSTYKDGPFKMVSFLQQEDNDFSKTTVPDATVFGVGLAYRKAKGLFKAQLYRRNEDHSNKNKDLIAVGYDYRLQRKLDVYAQAAHLTSSTNLGGEDFDGLTNPVDMHGVSFGFRYRF